MTATLRHSLARLENLQKLTELQRDLVGVESLVAPGRVSGSVRRVRAGNRVVCTEACVTRHRFPSRSRPAGFSVCEGVQTFPPTRRSPVPVAAAPRAMPSPGHTSLRAASGLTRPRRSRRAAFSRAPSSRPRASAVPESPRVGLAAFRGWTAPPPRT